MIINPSDERMDISFQWRRIPEFQNSPARMFYFAEVGARDVWRSGSTVGFILGGVPAHGSLVMVIWEAGRVVEGEDLDEWAFGEYVQVE
jgi:hypothetical protein